MSTTYGRNTRRALVGLAACLGLLGVMAVAGMVYLHSQFVHVERINGVFEGLGPRPPRPTEGPAADAVNILLLGMDRRSDVPDTGVRGQRPDAMMLVHVDADRDGITAVSLPRDSWVAVPGHGMATINAAYSYGGPSLAVQTVERLTAVRVDHLAVIDRENIVEPTLRSDPRKVLELLDTVVGHLSVDDEWSNRELASLVLSLRHLRAGDIRYLTAPVSGLGREGARSVVHLDAAEGASLWRAVRRGRVDDWAGRHPEAPAGPPP